LRPGTLDLENKVIFSRPDGQSGDNLSTLQEQYTEITISSMFFFAASF
jgi:hypothetical protein